MDNTTELVALSHLVNDGFGRTPGELVDRFAAEGVAVQVDGYGRLAVAPAVRDALVARREAAEEAERLHLAEAAEVSRRARAETEARRARERGSPRALRNAYGQAQTDVTTWGENLADARHDLANAGTEAVRGAASAQAEWCRAKLDEAKTREDELHAKVRDLPDAPPAPPDGLAPLDRLRFGEKHKLGAGEGESIAAYAAREGWER